MPRLHHLLLVQKSLQSKFELDGHQPRTERPLRKSYLGLLLQIERVDLFQLAFLSRGQLCRVRRTREAYESEEEGRFVGL